MKQVIKLQKLHVFQRVNTHILPRSGHTALFAVATSILTMLSGANAVAQQSGQLQQRQDNEQDNEPNNALQQTHATDNHDWDYRQHEVTDSRAKATREKPAEIAANKQQMGPKPSDRVMPDVATVDRGAQHLRQPSTGSSSVITTPAQNRTSALPSRNTGVNSASDTFGGSDDELMKELSAAAASDNTERKKSEGSTLEQTERRQQDPANFLFGKETLGNEANPALWLVLDVGLAYFSSEDRIRMGGHAPTTNGPVIQGGELGVAASVDPYFRVDCNFSLNHVHIEELFLTTTSLPWNLQLRAGQFNSKIGRQNPTHLHAWDFAIHPIPNQFLFGSHGIALPGAELSYLFPFPWYVELIGTVQMGASGSYRTQAATSNGAGFKDFLYPVRLLQFFDVGDDWGLQLGLNSVFGPSALGSEHGNRTESYGADLMLKWRPIGQGQTGYVFVKWTTEGWFRNMQVPNDLWRDAGGYSDLVVGLSKNWDIGVRGEIWRKIQGDAPTKQNKRANFGIDMLQAVGQLSYKPSHFSRIRAQYSIQQSELFSLSHAALVQLEVSAGAHGAHQY